ncbi:MAG: sulfatase-like hydrolase/transferase, partial [Sedimentisphaerales bacterium]
MRRRDFLRLTIGTGASLWLPTVSSATDVQRKKPNIVLVVIDELGYYELSCMGNRLLETPNMDRLAREGMRFTQILAGAPVCAPTRCCLMTGKHLGHASVRRNPGQEA